MNDDPAHTPARAPLAGVHVLDFTRVLAGPFCTMMLADMGADVLKIESPVGDETRAWGPPWLHTAADEPASAYYLSVNRNKRSIVLDLKTAEGQAIARQLAARSHLVVENFKPGGMAAFRLGYDALRAHNAALVYASITGYGQTGPYRDRPGYDFIIQAQSGLMSITGPAEGEPHKVGVAICDVIAGLFAAMSCLAALRHAERTGIGQRLDIALFDTAIAALVNIASNALIGQQIPPRLGNAHPSIVPYQPFMAADRPFALGVGNDRQFAALAALAGHPEWASDSRFATNPARVQHRDVLVAQLAEAFATRPADAWVHDLLALGIPAGPVNDVLTALHDPHTQARGLVHDVAYHDTIVRLVGPAVGFSATPPRLYAPPPRQGEHTDSVLAELGYDEAAIADLRARGVCG